MEDSIENVINVITIVVDPEQGRPRLDIGNISPLAAYTLLQAATDALYDCIPTTSVVFDDEVINEYDFVIDDDDDD